MKPRQLMSTMALFLMAGMLLGSSPLEENAIVYPLGQKESGDFEIGIVFNTDEIISTSDGSYIESNASVTIDIYQYKGDQISEKISTKEYAVSNQSMHIDDAVDLLIDDGSLVRLIISVKISNGDAYIPVKTFDLYLERNGSDLRYSNYRKWNEHQKKNLVMISNPLLNLEEGDVPNEAK